MMASRHVHNASKCWGFRLQRTTCVPNVQFPQVTYPRQMPSPPSDTSDGPATRVSCGHVLGRLPSVGGWQCHEWSTIASVPVHSPTACKTPFGRRFGRPAKTSVSTPMGNAAGCRYGARWCRRGLARPGRRSCSAARRALPYTTQSPAGRHPRLSNVVVRHGWWCKVLCGVHGEWS